MKIKFSEINYIKNENNGGVIYPFKIRYARSAIGVVKLICSIFLFDLKGYLLNASANLSIKYKVPIFISYDLIFIYHKALNHYDNIFINIINIKSYENMDKFIRIIFNNGDDLFLDISAKNYENIVKNVILVNKYKESLL